MEKTHPHSQTKLQTLQRYHQLTSPITPFSTVKNQNTIKEQLKRNASLRLDCIKQKNNKIYAIDANTSMSELKASAILYQVPEFSAPEVNFEVAEQIKKKVDEVKNEVITHLPEISKSSNYAPRKLQHQISHRSAVKELQQWLKSKLKQPPTAVQDTIDYKNMIMGVGMKELIRLISRRCNQEGRIAEQIWELTWGICREIILYLSKRARKCQQVLQEELGMMRMVSEKEFERLKQQNMKLKNKVNQLQEQNRQLHIQLQKMKKRTVVMEEENKNLVFDNFHLQQDFKNLLEENLAIYLEIGDKNKRGWIKKMYKNISRTPTPQYSNLNKFYRQKITGTIQNRIKQEQITEEVAEVISKEQIQRIGDMVIEQVMRQKKKRAAKQKKQRNSKLPKNVVNGQVNEGVNQDQNQTQFITEPYEEEELSEDQVDPASCKKIVEHLRQEFKPIDVYVQTDSPVLIHAYAGTNNPQLKENGLNVYSYMITTCPQIGVNTEDPKDQTKNSKKKDKEKEKQKEKGKQNSSQQVKRQKSKLLPTVPISKDKLKAKAEKDKTNTLQTVQQQYKQALAQRQDIRIANHSSHVEEESRLSVMTNSELDNLLGKEPQMGGNAPKTSYIQKQNDSKVQIPTKQSKVELKKVTQKQMPKMETTYSKQIQIKNYEKEVESEFKNVVPVKKPTYMVPKPFYHKQNVSIYKEESQPVSFDSEIKSDCLVRNTFESNEKKEQSCLTLIRDAQPITFICSECKKIINLAQEKAQVQRVRRAEKKATYSPFRNSKLTERQTKKSNVVTPCSSLKKLALNPIESCKQEQSVDQYFAQQKFEGRRLQKQYTKNSSGYIHDLAYKKQIEQHMKSPYGKREQTQEKVQASEQSLFILSKTQPHKFFISQIMTANKQFISSMNNSIGQTSDSSEQYLQLVKQINSIPENKITMTEKGAFSIIQKNVFPILSQLLVVVRKAVKTNKIPEAMKLFTSLPSIISNRINRKYGVKILATKHLKVILMAIKAAGRYTDKLKTIQLMMFTDCKSLQSQDFFIYLLIMGLFDPTYSATRVLNTEQSYTIRRICEEHLTKQPQVYSQFQRLKESKGESMLLGDVVNSIITNYRLLKINRIQELGFIFLMLKKDQNWMNYKDFITFMATFTIDNTLKINITKQLLQFCDVKNRDNTIGITENIFTKFLTSCKCLNLTLLQSNVNDQIQQYSTKDHDILPELVDKLYETVFKIKSSYYLGNNVAEQESVPSASKLEDISSALDIGEMSASQPLPNETEQTPTPCIENIKVAQKLRTYSNFTYKICNYLQRDEQTKFLSARQKKFIKLYLVLYILNCEVQKLVGIVDYFSNSMLGLICTPLQQFSLSSKGSVNV